jgi:hypothetical protein
MEDLEKQLKEARDKMWEADYKFSLIGGGTQENYQKYLEAREEYNKVKGKYDYLIKNKGKENII